MFSKTFLIKSAELLCIFLDILKLVVKGNGRGCKLPLFVHSTVEGDDMSVLKRGK